jgi:hypothetical protein
VILLILAFQVARITGVNHQYPAWAFFFFFAVLGFEPRAYTVSHSSRPFL